MRTGTETKAKSNKAGVESDFPSKQALGATLTFKQPEKAFMAQVIRYAELMGWRVYHTHDSRRSNPGFPDLVMVRRPRVVFAELKSQRGRVTVAQRDWLMELRASGQEAYLFRPSDWREIEETLKR